MHPLSNLLFLLLMSSWAAVPVITRKSCCWHISFCYCDLSRHAELARSFSLWNDHKNIIKAYMYSYKYRKAKAKIITKTTTTLMTHLFICSSLFILFPPHLLPLFPLFNNNNNNRARWQLSAMMASSWMWTGKLQTFKNQMKLIKREHLYFMIY